ncbi:response regulator transcription factor [bacterium]|nr:response regulator transcription factor [bacterium]
MKEKSVLVVDDEEDILELLSYNLGREHYTVFCAATGEDALKLAMKTTPDLIVLDLMLPGLSGLEVTRRLKADSQTRNIPIVMLTARGDETDVVIGLELGADDYITKPFSIKILIARINTIFRRLHTVPETSEDKIIQIKNLTIHPGMREVRIDGNLIELTFTEFQVLVYLIKRPGWVSTRTQIVDAVRGQEYAVTDRSVDVQIVGLRKKLGIYGNYIRTVRGVGYKFSEEL